MVIELKDGEMLTHTIFKAYQGFKRGRKRVPECVLMNLETYNAFRTELAFAYQPFTPNSKDTLAEKMFFNGLKIIRTHDIDDNTIEVY